MPGHGADNHRRCSGPPSAARSTRRLGSRHPVDQDGRADRAPDLRLPHPPGRYRRGLGVPRRGVRVALAGAGRRPPPGGPGTGPGWNPRAIPRRRTGVDEPCQWTVSPYRVAVSSRSGSLAVIGMPVSAVSGSVSPVAGVQAAEPVGVHVAAGVPAAVHDAVRGGAVVESGPASAGVVCSGGSVPWRWLAPRTRPGATWFPATVERGSSGFPRGSAPRRYQRRTPRVETGPEHGPGTTLPTTSVGPPIRVFSHIVRPRVARPAGVARGQLSPRAVTKLPTRPAVGKRPTIPGRTDRPTWASRFVCAAVTPTNHRRAHPVSASPVTTAPAVIGTHDGVQQVGRSPVVCASTGRAAPLPAPGF